jgi:hypothetical protein
MPSGRTGRLLTNATISSAVMPPGFSSTCTPSSRVPFIHDRELPWLLPGVEPTFRRAEVLAIAVVDFDRTRIRSQRVLWDHATLLDQLSITVPAATGPAR